MFFLYSNKFHQRDVNTDQSWTRSKMIFSDEGPQVSVEPPDLFREAVGSNVWKYKKRQ